MAAGDIKLVYGTAADATITLASLATSSTKLVGRESDAIVNTSNLFLDYLCSGKITTGTSPTTAKSIEVWAIASWDGTTWPSVFDGTDSAETIPSAEQKTALCRHLVFSCSTNATSDTAYEWSGISLANVFGGVIPPKFAFFVTHDTAVNLNSTSGNHQIRIQPVYENAASA
jgi:hypothetical protein